MSDTEYTLPKVWVWDKESTGINRPFAGPTNDKVLPAGEKALQLYSLGTPDGVKITVMLEELLALGKTDAEYDLHAIHIGKEEQYGSDFVELNPNSQIPVLLDRSSNPAQPVFESCAILHFLANKFDAFLPTDPVEYTRCLSWLFWLESSASFLGGGFGHFFRYAPYPMEYPINRYAVEAKRQLDVLNRHFAEHEYMFDSGYSIADIAIWPWHGRLALGEIYEAVTFLDTGSYEHLLRWAKAIAQRPAAQRGVAVEYEINSE